MDVVLLVNPAARSGARTGVVERTVERLRAADVRTTVLSGGSAEESSALLRTALDLGAQTVIVAGGDGTAALAIQELAGSGAALGILPIGTGNDLATELGLRELDADAAADAVIAGTTRRIDLARVRRADGVTRLFATVLASGFDSRVNDLANSLRWPRGPRRYDIAVLIEFLRLHPERFRLTIDLEDGAQEVIDGPLMMVSVGNGRTYGGGIPICPEARLDDGLLDLTVVRAAGRASLLRLLPRVYRGTHAASGLVVTRRVRGISLEADGVTAYADGDPIGSLPLRVDVVPQALTVLAPPASAVS